MKSTTKLWDFDALRERYDAETSMHPEGLGVPEPYEYIRYKAFVFLTLGPDAYREFDAFNQPPAGWPELAQDAVTIGCRQLLDWKGLTPEQPLDGVGIGGFYSMLRIFHFGCVMQEALALESDPVHFCDRMQMRHVVNGDQLTLYNRVPLAGTEERPSAPCPYCGAALRTSRAKQCRACGTDWHDPENVRMLK